MNIILRIKRRYCVVQSWAWTHYRDTTLNILKLYVLLVLWG